MVIIFNMKYLICNEIGFIYIYIVQIIIHIIIIKNYKKLSWLYKTINCIKKYNMFKIFISLKNLSLSQKLHCLLLANLLIVFNTQFPFIQSF